MHFVKGQRSFSWRAYWEEVDSCSKVGSHLSHNWCSLVNSFGHSDFSVAFTCSRYAIAAIRLQLSLCLTFTKVNSLAYETALGWAAPFGHAIHASVCNKCLPSRNACPWEVQNGLDPVDTSLCGLPCSPWGLDFLFWHTCWNLMQKFDPYSNFAYWIWSLYSAAKMLIHSHSELIHQCHLASHLDARRTPELLLCSRNFHRNEESWYFSEFVLLRSYGPNSVKTGSCWLILFSNGGRSSDFSSVFVDLNYAPYNCSDSYTELIGYWPQQSLHYLITS